MIEFHVEDLSGDIWDEQARVTALAAIAMVLEKRGGVKESEIIRQEVRIARSMDTIEALGFVHGHLDPNTRVLTLNAGVLAGEPWGKILTGEGLYSRVVLTAAHEAEHAAQMLRGHVLPQDMDCEAEYDTDPWYEVQARQTSMDVFKGLYPHMKGGLEMGPSRRVYWMPEKSEYEARWQEVAQGKKFWAEKYVSGISKTKYDIKSGVR